MAWFDCAIHRPISVNHGGALAANLGLVLHHAVGNGSLFATFNNPARGASTHFWVSKTGVIEEYLPTTVRCWGGVNLNAAYIQVETEGCASPPYAEPMTEQMLAALGRLYAEGMRRHHWPAVPANSYNGHNAERGLGYHRMPGSGASTACICDTRLAYRTNILTRATGQPSPPPPAPPPAAGPSVEEVDLLLVKGSKGGIWLIAGAERIAVTSAEIGRYKAAGIKQRDDWSDAMIAKFRVAPTPK